MYGLQRYLFDQRARKATFDAEGRLYFLFNVSGSDQVWSLDRAGGWPTQRTVYFAGVSFVSGSPTRPEAVFGKPDRDSGRTQLRRLNEDWTITPLTGAPETDHYWGGWSHDGDRFAFGAKEGDSRTFDVYVQGRDDEAATLVSEGESRRGTVTVAGWSPSNDRLAVRRSRSKFDQSVAVIDLEDGEERTLAGDDVRARYRSVQWAPDGEGLYLVTDEGNDTLYLARLDLDGTLTRLVDGGEWNVDGLSVDVDTGRCVYSRNVEGYTDLTVARFTGPTTIEARRDPDLPGDAYADVAWGPEGERFAVTAVGRSLNPNVFTVDVASGETRRWTGATTGGIPESTFVEPELVRYESFDGLEVPALFSLPHGVTAGDDASVPVVVDVHGGPEEQRRPTFSSRIQFFLASGYAVLEPNVRGSTGYGRDYTALDDGAKRADCVRDLRAGVDWLRRRPEVDDDRIAVLGNSYGGFLALSALVEYPDCWAAGVTISGIVDLVTFLENVEPWRREIREREYGSLEDDSDLLRSLSPITDLDAIRAPLFVVHGVEDRRVPVEQAKQVVDRVADAGLPVEKLILEDCGHGIASSYDRLRTYRDVAAFFAEHLRDVPCKSPPR